MKIQVTIKWGAVRQIEFTVHNDWSTDKLHEVTRKVMELFEFCKDEKERPRGYVQGSDENSES